MLDREQLTKLAKTVANADKNAAISYSFGQDKFSYAELNETLRKELRELAKDNQTYRENKNTIFSIIEDTITDVLPKKVLEQYGQFAEIKTYEQGDKPLFKVKITESSRRRAKQFITKVGLAGVYEVFKLAGKTYEIPMSAWGGAAQISIEEFLDGRVDFADLLDVLMEGLDEAVYKEIQNALIAAVNALPSTNKQTDNTFVETKMDNLLSVADSYGQATIYCTYQFAATMFPSSNNWVSDNMRDKKWYDGFLGDYKGHRVIILPQSYTDETNTTKVIDPRYCYIIPTGANEKPVKLAFEGGTLVKEVDNEDWSKEYRVYKKFGAGAIVTNNICVYINSSLS